MTEPADADGSVLRVGSIVIACRSLERMVAFWTAALGYVPHAAGRSADWCRLDDPHGRVNLSLQEMPFPPELNNRLHLDLYAQDQRVEVERLRALGAEVRREPDPGDDFVVMADPEGNLFCVVGRGEVRSGG